MINIGEILNIAGVSKSLIDSIVKLIDSAEEKKSNEAYIEQLERVIMLLKQKIERDCK